MKLSIRQIVYLRRVAKARQAMQNSKPETVKAVRLESLSEMVRRYAR